MAHNKYNITDFVALKHNPGTSPIGNLITIVCDILNIFVCHYKALIAFNIRLLDFNTMCRYFKTNIISCLNFVIVTKSCPIRLIILLKIKLIYLNNCIFILCQY